MQRIGVKFLQRVKFGFTTLWILLAKSFHIIVRATASPRPSPRRGEGAEGEAVALSSTTSILVVIRGEAIRRVQERETALLADAIMEFDNIIGQPAGR